MLTDAEHVSPKTAAVFVEHVGRNFGDFQHPIIVLSNFGLHHIDEQFSKVYCDIGFP